MALIDMGADINIKSNNGQSPLVHALLGKKESIAKILIHRRADVNAKDGHGKTPLMTAIRVAAMLSSNRAKIVRIVERLVQEGADINAKDESGETPLSIAQDEELQEVVNLLLAKGATVGTKHQTLMARLARKS
ncbi:hypothetical protein ANOM_008624 [Aspergillus nomiae NRRL 13137]|uniref:Uncharacterized protein n=1 Tax=Aspergillus nomiae NRRL (strain ATCC 15546 / NRRL 13137 / CBS 260.88 / M93) TaxID=1509407 RepID=A0A0L1ITW1_ASPN3|nr:uncharacterized protein ANOM_008624 [Aspergillus nomiae NRRL 13137]KNG82845.1 hypothetical protein ANOM_008624 [Aspergillus nomiae NRRL 13137]